MPRLIDAPRLGLQSEAEVLDWAQKSLGPLERLDEVTSVASPHRVVTLSTRNGDTVVAKWFHDSTAFFRTLDALTDHAVALGSAAPRLIDHHEGLKALVISAVPGIPVTGGQALDPTIHFQVGVLLRQFHESAPSTQSTDVAKTWAARLSELADRAEQTLGEALVSEARSLAMQLLDLGPVTLSPIHGSNTPEHWLHDPDRGLHLIGFSQSEYDPWIVDTLLLERHYWRYSPDLRQAFFTGYERQPDGTDLLLLKAKELIDVLEQQATTARSRTSKADALRNQRDLDVAFGGTLF